MPKLHENKSISVDKLIPFPSHAFKPYEGRRFEALVNSVRESGVLVPIIVRPKGEMYEILSGHNRTTAARAAGLSEVPAVIREDLSEEEARMVVAVTNLIQRSFADLSHSERAAALTAHYDVIKSQGKRSDLIESLNALIGSDATCVPTGHRLKARDTVARTYGLSGSVVARYLRVARLVGALQKRLDDDEFSLRAAVELSHLSEESQAVVDKTLENDDCRVDVSAAGALRTADTHGELNEEKARNILTANGRAAKARFKPVRIDAGVVAKYFNDGQSENDVADTISRALEAWFDRVESEQ